MGKRYSQLSGDERNQLQRGLIEGGSLRVMARSMDRNPSTLSRECRRGWLQRSYDVVQGGGWARSHRRRGPCKLLPGSPGKSLDGAGACADFGTGLVAGVDCREATRGTPRRLQSAGLPRDHITVHPRSPSWRAQEAAGRCITAGSPETSAP